MTITLMQKMNNVKPDFGVSKTPAVTNDTISKEKFGKVFNQIVSSNASKRSEKKDQPMEEISESLSKIMGTKSLEEFLNELGVEIDDSMLMVSVDGSEIPVDQLLNTESLLSILNVDELQLQEIIDQLTLEDINVQDVWTLLEQAPMLMNEVVSALTGESTMSEKDATVLLQFLKLAQLAGEKTDTVYQQQFTLSNLKNALETAGPQIVQLMQLTQQGQAQSNSNTSSTVFQQLIQPISTEQKVEVVTTTSNSNNEGMLQQNQQSSQVRTVTINLPTNPASQSEALAKEIENLLNRSQVSNQQGSIKLMLKLFPENLGQIRIEIVQQNGVMTARLLASTSAAKELLDSNLNQLKTAFVAQNIQMDRIDVSQSLQDAERNLRDQSLFGNFFNQRPKENEDEGESEDESADEQKEFSEFLTEEVQA